MRYDTQNPFESFIADVWDILKELCMAMGLVGLLCLGFWFALKWSGII